MILNVYKEKGWTSFDVVAKLRGLLKIKRIGHAGTLDPLAEGVLVVLTDQDTKKQDELMLSEKEYLAEIAFGADSPTYDMEGPLTFNEASFSKGEFEKTIRDLLPKYIGEFEQEVPAYSAVKVDGKKLYKQARKGKADLLELPKKTVTVLSLDLENISEEKIQERSLFTITLKIICKKGFYVRSLAHDLGQDLGTGAVLTKLIRTRVGDFSVEDSQKIKSLSEQFQA